MAMRQWQDVVGWVAGWLPVVPICSEIERQHSMNCGICSTMKRRALSKTVRRPLPCGIKTLTHTIHTSMQHMSLHAHSSHMHACTHAHMHACIHGMHVYMHEHTTADMHIWHIYVHVPICAYMYMCMRTHARAHTHAHARRHTHKHTHTLGGQP